MDVLAIPSLISPIGQCSPLPVIADSFTFPGTDHTSIGVWQRKCIDVGGFLIHIIEVGYCPAKMVRAATEEGK